MCDYLRCRGVDMKWPLISELVAGIKAGDSKSYDITNDCYSRAKSDQHNAILSLDDSVLDKAAAVDKAIENGEDTGPLAGIPFLVKDNFLTHSTATTAASKMLDGFQSPYQATAVERLEAAGALMMGKVNLDEFAHGSSTENSAFGPTQNPKDPSRVPGGSSGGSAAAVAMEIAPFALGTDTGGSIRLPASFCGVVGMKPTYGLVSRNGVIAMASSTDVIGPLTLNVADSGFILDVLSGKDPLDSTTIDREDSYVAEPKGIEGLKIGIVDGHMGDDIDEAVKAKVQAAIDKLEGAGAKVKTVTVPDDAAALAAYYVIVPAEISSNLARYDGVKYGLNPVEAQNLLDTYLESRGTGFGQEPIRRILTGTYVLSSGYQDAYYKQAQKVRTLLRREYDEVFDDVDVLLGPTAPTTAFKLGEKQDPISMYMTDRLTIAANLIGAPAMSLPLADEAEGLPVGLQIVAPRRKDKQLLDIAASVEGIV